MRKTAFFPLVMAFFSLAILGCAGTQLGSRPVYLDDWLEDEAYQRLAGELRANTFMRGMPFIIVKARGEVVSTKIDRLTDEVRERLHAVLLEYPEINLMRRHPARVIDRPYKLQELRCDRFKEHRMFLTLDIRPLGSPGDRLARVNIRAIDLKQDTWVRGFSVYKDVSLTSLQSENLNAKPQPDEYLRGLKYLPFTETQKDEMAAYLARNLSCIFREGYWGRDLKVSITVKGRSHSVEDIAWFVQKQLTFCNEIRLVQEDQQAVVNLVAEAKETGSATDLCQFWISATDQRGLATYAYYIDEGTGNIPLTGKWEIRDLNRGRTQGYLEIMRDNRGQYIGNLFKPGGAVWKKGINIVLSGNHVDWSFYDEDDNRTFEVKGLLVESEDRMIVKVTTFPSSNGPMDQELLRVE